jgi:pimeloyl-ACP methyl ester carboxylesterase
MSFSTVNGVRMYWRCTGDKGDPLVLVHGSWTDHHTWDLVVPSLASAFRVLSYDRRGHSQSERPAGQGSIHEDVADLAALIEHLGFAPAHVVGGSLGGSIALRLAGRRPDLLRTMVVHEPPLFQLLDREPAAEAALATIRERTDAVVQLLKAGDASAAARQFVDTIALGEGAWNQLPSALRNTFIFNAPTFWDEMQGPDTFGLDLSSLRAFQRPTLLTLGGQSAAFFALVVRQLAAALPDAETRTFPADGHVPHVSHPREFAEAVKSFAQQ